MVVAAVAVAGVTVVGQSSEVEGCRGACRYCCCGGWWRASKIDAAVMYRIQYSC